jgi:hypothetical protein
MKSMVIVSDPARQLLLLLFLLWSPAASATPTLVQILFDVPSGRAVEISLANGSRYDGTIAHVSADSVLLDVREPEWAAPTTTLALDEITRVRERRSNLGRGAGWGAVSGAVVGGSLGLLSGLYLASTNDTQDSDAGPVIGGTLVGAAMGAAAIGVVGLGVGAMTKSWRTIYGVEEPDREESAGDDRAPSRLDVGIGSGILERDDVEFQGFAGRLGLLKQVSAHMEMGPHFEYVHLGGTETVYQDGGYYTVNSDPSFQASLGIKLNARRTGFAPPASGGFGWYWGDGG